MTAETYTDSVDLANLTVRGRKEVTCRMESGGPIPWTRDSFDLAMVGGPSRNDPARPWRCSSLSLRRNRGLIESGYPRPSAYTPVASGGQIGLTSRWSALLRLRAE